MRKSPLIIIAMVLSVAALISSIFIVDEREKALVLQFCQNKQVKT